MSRHITRIATDPDWYEPYRISQAVRSDNTIYVSGQAGIDEAGRTVSPDFETQARQAFINIEKVLAAGGATMADIVKVNIMVTDMSHLDTIIRLRGEYLSQPYPADTLLQVAGLAQPDWQVEIDATAVVTDEKGA